MIFYFLVVFISLELTRVIPDRNIFSINVELTSTFLLYTGLVHHHHRILKRHIQRDICSYTTRWEYAKSCTGIFVTSTTCKKTTFFTRDKTSRSWKVALSRLQHKEGLWINYQLILCHANLVKNLCFLCWVKFTCNIDC